MNENVEAMKGLGAAQREAIHQLKTHGRVRAMDMYRLVGPHGSVQYGVNTMRRLEQRGLVRRVSEGAAVWFELTGDGE